MIFCLILNEVITSNLDCSKIHIKIRPVLSLRRKLKGAYAFLEKVDRMVTSIITNKKLFKVIESMRVIQRRYQAIVILILVS